VDHLLHDKHKEALQTSCLHTTSMVTPSHTYFSSRDLILGLGSHAEKLEVLVEVP